MVWLPQSSSYKERSFVGDNFERDLDFSDDMGKKKEKKKLSCYHNYSHVNINFKDLKFYIQFNQSHKIIFFNF